MGVLFQSTTPLAANAQYSTGANNTRTGGEGTHTGEPSTIVVSGKADQAGICRIEDSADGTNFRFVSMAAAQPGVVFSVQACVIRAYWQVVFQNGATAQSTFTISVDELDSPLYAILVELRKLNMSVLAMQDRQPIGRDSHESLFRT